MDMNRRGNLSVEPLGSLLRRIGDIPPEPDKGSWYTLYVEGDGDGVLDENTFVVVVLVTDTIYDPKTVEVGGRQFTAIVDLWLVQDIVEQAMFQKLEANAGELVAALDFYLENDAYLEL